MLFARSEGLEPTTPGTGIRYSIQLSYERYIFRHYALCTIYNHTKLRISSQLFKCLITKLIKLYVILGTNFDFFSHFVILFRNVSIFLHNIAEIANYFYKNYRDSVKITRAILSESIAHKIILFASRPVGQVFTC